MKIYAKGTQRSVSEMVTKYFESVVEEKIDENELSPKMKSILDKIPKNQKQYTDEELDDFRREYLEKKYS